VIRGQYWGGGDTGTVTSVPGRLRRRKDEAHGQARPACP
jgi:hypothetical protein